MPKTVIVNVVFWNSESKKLRIKAGTRVEDVLKILRVNREAVLCLLNNELVTEDEKIIEDSELKLLSVVSGG